MRSESKKRQYKKKQLGLETQIPDDDKTNPNRYALVKAFNNFQKYKYRYLQTIGPSNPDYIDGFNELPLS
jgi:hypothetical protein